VCVFIEGVRKENELEFSFRLSKNINYFLLITLTDKLARLLMLQKENLKFCIYSNPSFRFYVRIRRKCMNWTANWLRRVRWFSYMFIKKKFTGKKSVSISFAKWGHSSVCPPWHVKLSERLRRFSISFKPRKFTKYFRHTSVATK